MTDLGPIVAGLLADLQLLVLVLMVARLMHQSYMQHRERVEWYARLAHDDVRRLEQENAYLRAELAKVREGSGPYRHPGSLS